MQTHCSSTLLASFFHQVVNRYPFTWDELFVSKYHEEYSLHRNWSPHWPKVANEQIVLGYLDILTRPSRELQIWIFVSKSELTLKSSGFFIERIISDCVPSIGNLMVRKCKRAPLTFIFRWSQNSKATGLNSSDKVSIETFFSTTVFSLKVIWWVFEHYFLRWRKFPLTENIAARLRFLFELRWMMNSDGVCLIALEWMRLCKRALYCWSDRRLKSSEL